jgi:hypothetical protein
MKHMSAATMKRSTEHVLFVTNSDFNLIAQGQKTATSRLGDRRSLWPIGSKILIEDQDGLRLFAVITHNFVTFLDAVDDRIAVTIGEYGSQGHREDFLNIYPEYTDDIGLSIVGFKVQ